MKIMVVGGTGRAGSAIVTEALKRGHEVVITTRDASKVTQSQVQVIEKSPLALTSEDIAMTDAVVDAMSVPWGSGKGYLHLDVATHLVSLLRNTKIRGIFILGSASLRLLGSNHAAIEDYPPQVEKAPWFDGALHQYYELNYLRWVKNVDWVGFSPGEAFPRGEATDYRMTDGLLVPDENGQAIVTTGTMALAILDEIETAKHHQKHIGLFNK